MRQQIQTMESSTSTIQFSQEIRKNKKTGGGGETYTLKEKRNINQLQYVDLICILFQTVKSNYKNSWDNRENLNIDCTYLITIRNIDFFCVV